MNVTEQQEKTGWCFIKLYLNAEKYLPDFSYSMGNFYNNGITSLFGTYHFKDFIYHREPAEIRSRQYKTPYYIYDGVVISRTPENEREFLEIEQDRGRGIKYDEIWKCFVRFNPNPHSDEDLIISDTIDPVGAFFAVDYKDDLQRLITIHVWNGWKRTEVLASIHKLLTLKPEEVLDPWQWEKIEHLRTLVHLDPELAA